MSSFQQLRTMALEARKGNANDRQERYIKARDEAFDVITDGVMEKIQNAAKEGRFRYPIYKWVNQSRGKYSTDADVEETTTEATQLYFGCDETGKNGIHIMALVQPTGIALEETLISKLREYFDSKVEDESVDEKTRRENQLRVFLQRKPNNPRQCAIFVSWERPQGTPRFRPAFQKQQFQQEHHQQQTPQFQQRPSTAPATGQQPVSFTRPSVSLPFRTGAPFRGNSHVFRGATRPGRGRGAASHVQNAA